MSGDKHAADVLRSINALEAERDEAGRQQAAALTLVSHIRQALGDNGRRMQDELIEHCRELAKAAAEVDDMKKACDEAMVELRQTRAAIEQVGAERDQLRAAARLTLAHDVVPFATTELLRRVLTKLATDHVRNRSRPLPFWSYVKEATSLGSNCSAGLARWAGFDPDTGQRIDPPTATGKKGGAA